MMPHLFLNRRGQFYVNHERLEHEKSIRVLLRAIRYVPQLGFQIVLGREQACIEVEARVGFFVEEASCVWQSGKPVLNVRLSDETLESFVQPHVRLAIEDDALELQVKACLTEQAKEPPIFARFRRNAYQQVLPYLEADAHDVRLNLAALDVVGKAP